MTRAQECACIELDLEEEGEEEIAIGTCMGDESDESEGLPLPEWLRCAINAASEVLGLQEWDIYVKLVPHATYTKKKGQSPEHAVADTDVAWRYFFALITFADCIEEDDEGYRTITHEMLHVAQAPAIAACERMVGLVPKELRKHARHLWDDANEPQTVLLARILAPLVREKAEAAMAA